MRNIAVVCFFIAALSLVGCNRCRPCEDKAGSCCTADCHCKVKKCCCQGVCKENCTCANCHCK